MDLTDNLASIIHHFVIKLTDPSINITGMSVELKFWRKFLTLGI